MSPAEKILFIGRNRVLSDVACQCLTRNGYCVVLAGELAAAAALIQADPPALAIVDVEPSDDTFAAPRLVRNLLADGGGRVLVLTQTPDARMSRILHRMGVSSLAKPITPDALTATVREELALRMRDATDSPPSDAGETSDVSAELVNFLVFDEALPSLDMVYEKAPSLEMKLAASLLDMFDGRRSLRALITERPKAAKKILFLATYLTSVNLLIPVAGSTAKCNSPDLCKT
jgi:DNA-binding response OmpR family regulator